MLFGSGFRVGVSIHHLRAMHPNMRRSLHATICQAHTPFQVTLCIERLYGLHLDSKEKCFDCPLQVARVVACYLSEQSCGQMCSAVRHRGRFICLKNDVIQSCVVDLITSAWLLGSSYIVVVSHRYQKSECRKNSSTFSYQFSSRFDSLFALNAGVWVSSRVRDQARP